MPRYFRFKGPKGFVATSLILVVLFCIVLFCINNRNNYTVLIPPDVNITEYPPFEPEIHEDFPTVETKIPRIPHIIHQTFKTEMVQSYYVKYIETFTDLNPNWDYFFWTDDSARKLIADKYPSLLPLYDSYYLSIIKADVLRYVVLYEYGGLYADLDFECLRGMDRLTYKYACIFPPEPFEMTAIVKNWPYFINNAFMMCRPKHPFLKQVLDYLVLYQVMDGLIDVAGPAFITSQFIRYNQLQLYYNYSTNYTIESNSPYFYKGKLPEDDNNAVYVPNSKYFFNKLDNHGSRINFLHSLCNSEFSRLMFNQRRACLELKRRFENPRNLFAYAEHHWIRFYDSTLLFISNKLHGKTHIKEVVKKYKMYS